MTELLSALSGLGVTDVLGAGGWLAAGIAGIVAWRNKSVDGTTGLLATQNKLINTLLVQQGELSDRQRAERTACDAQLAEMARRYESQIEDLQGELEAVRAALAGHITAQGMTVPESIERRATPREAESHGA